MESGQIKMFSDSMVPVAINITEYSRSVFQTAYPIINLCKENL